MSHEIDHTVVPCAGRFRIHNRVAIGGEGRGPADTNWNQLSHLVHPKNVDRVERLADTAVRRDVPVLSLVKNTINRCPIMANPLRTRCSPIPFPVVITVLGGILVVLTSLFAPVQLQIASHGLLIVALLVVTTTHREQPSLPLDLEIFRVPILLARDNDVFEIYRGMADSLEVIATNKDPIYRHLALDRTKSAAHQVRELAEGRVVFTCTETWRNVYARLLSSPGLHLYRSIACVRTSTYWQDEPGRQSMEINYELASSGRLNVERIAILPDNLWPAGEFFPLEPLRTWLHEQHAHGIRIYLVRQSALIGDLDLVVDLGIYGTRAVGMQELDDQGRTVRFTLSFDFPEVLAAEKRWERLSVYSISYQNLLDQSLGPG